MKAIAGSSLKVHTALLAFVIALGSVFVAAPPQRAIAFASGDGSSDAPYQISTCLELQAMQDELAAHYELIKDIDCGHSPTGNDSSLWNEGEGFDPVGDCWGPGFAGSFNGNGYSIINLFINRPTTDRQALFGCTNDGALIENVGMVEVNITGQRYAGGITGVLVGANSTIRNTFVTGTITLVYGETVGSGQYAGGISSGQEGGSLIDNSYSTAVVDTYYPLQLWGEGGLVGYSYNDSVVSDSFWDTELSGNQFSYGGGTGKTTVEMKTLSTYTDAGWNFDTVWGLSANVNNGYPYLKNAKNIADLNGDEVADIEQPNVGGYTSGISGKTVAIDVGDGCELTTDDTADEKSLAAQDIAYDYESGLWEFETDCGISGHTTTVKMYYYDTAPDGKQLRKYLPTSETYTTITDAVLTTETIDGHTVTVVTYQVTDNGQYDDNADPGVIADPAGLATPILIAPNTGVRIR